MVPSSGSMWRRYTRFLRPNVAADVDDELRFHFSEREAELRTRGLSAEEARDTARREFGDVETTRQSLREIGYRIERRHARSVSWDALALDVRYAARSLRARPALTAAVAGTMATVIAAASVMFGVVDRLFLSPPSHITAPDAVGRVHVVSQSTRGTRTTGGLPYGYFEIARAELRSARVAASTSGDVAVGSGTGAAKLRADFVSPGYFTLLGTRPALGRFFSDEEAHHLSGARVAVLGDRTWRRVFGGDPSVVGRTVVIGGVATTVIGVAPAGFHGTTLADVALWLPMAARYDAPSGKDAFTRPGNFLWTLIVRRAPNASAERVASELTPLIWSYGVQHGEIRTQSTRSLRAIVRPLRGAVGGNLQRTSVATVALWIAGITGILVLIACANVTGLLLLRAAGRRQEFAVRRALGVSGRRLVAQLLAESALLMAIAGAGAAILATTLGAALRTLLLPQFAADVWTTDTRVVIATVLAVFGAAVSTGLAPALYARRTDVRGALTGGSGARGGSARVALQRPLLVLQTALSLVLLVGAGLFLRSVYNLRTTDLGMDPERVITVIGDVEGGGWTAPRMNAFLDRAADRVRTVPGVERVALTGNVPLQSMNGGAYLHGDGIDSALVGRSPEPTSMNVSHGFFETVGMRLRRGRFFTDRDVRGAPPVTVVSETLARRLRPDGAVLGRCFFLGAEPRCWTIVGVVADAHTLHVVEEIRPQFYLPLAQTDLTENQRALLVRTRGDAEPYVAAVAHALADLTPNQPFIDVAVLEDTLDPEARPWRLGATVFACYGGFALLLAAVGLYAVTAYGVTMRTREIGVRVAVGGRPRHVVGLVLRDGLVIGLAGVALGLPAALALGTRVQGLLLDVGPHDPLVFTGAAVLLAVTATLAGFAPARRAARVSPTEALRAD